MKLEKLTEPSALIEMQRRGIPIRAPHLLAIQYELDRLRAEVARLVDLEEKLTAQTNIAN